MPRIDGLLTGEGDAKRGARAFEDLERAAELRRQPPHDSEPEPALRSRRRLGGDPGAVVAYRQLNAPPFDLRQKHLERRAFVRTKDMLGRVRSEEHTSE